MKTEIKLERSLTPNLDCVVLKSITGNHNNGRLKREILGLTWHNPHYKLNQQKSIMDSPCYSLLDLSLK